MKEKFNVEFLEEAVIFLDSLDEKTREKVFYNIWKSKSISDSELFKKIDNEIWEFRTKYGNKYVRLLAFWDKKNKMNTLVIACNGFLKSTSKTPKLQILKAKKLKEQYFKDKKSEL